MNETIKSEIPPKVSRRKIGASVVDLITVGRNENTFHRSGIVNTGHNRIRNGQMLSTYELAMIESNADMIRGWVPRRHEPGRIALKEVVSYGTTPDKPAEAEPIEATEEAADKETHTVKYKGKLYEVVEVNGATLMIPREEEGSGAPDEAGHWSMEETDTADKPAVIEHQDEVKPPVKPPQEPEPQRRTRWGGLRRAMVGLLAFFSLR